MLGATGMTVIVQLMSLLLVCVGAQILWNGASALFRCKGRCVISPIVEEAGVLV